MGFLWPKYLPLTSASEGTKYFRHAIALDEHRLKFLPQFYVDNVPSKSKEKSKSEAPSAESEKTKSKAPDEGGIEEVDREKRRKTAYKDHGSDTRRPQPVMEVWFSGVHCGQSCLLVSTLTIDGTST